MTTKEALERLKQPFNATPDTDSYFDAKEVAMKSLEKDLSIIKEFEKVRAEIIQVANEEKKYDEKWALGLRYAAKIIDKHKAELKGEAE